jgi:DNA-binding response OmpR family regulator
VKNLRRKVEADPASPRIILTVLGGGYRLGLSRDE